MNGFGRAVAVLAALLWVEAGATPGQPPAQPAGAEDRFDSAVKGSVEDEDAEGPERQGPAKVTFEKHFDETDNGVKAAQKRDEAINHLIRIIARTPKSSPALGDMLFQLSELYWEKSKFLYRAEMRRVDAQYKAFEEAKARGEKVSAPKADHAQSEKYRAEALQIYRQLLADAPDYPRNDEILFALGYNLQEQGKVPEAMKRYRELIKRFPDSRFVPDTYVQLGDQYFIQNDLERAKNAFSRALASKVPKVYSYALYKLAWCDYNEQAFAGALSKLQQVVDFAEQHGKGLVDLKNEALRDTVLVYVMLNQPEQAIAYYARKAPKRQVKLISRMGLLLSEHGNTEASTRVFRHLLADQGMHAEAPTWQQAVVRNFEQERKRGQVKAEVKLLVDRYRPGATWWQHHAGNTGVLKEAFEVTEAAMRNLVTEYHQEATRTKQVETYRLARDIYKQYLDAYASSPDPQFVSGFAFNVRLYYAEILWTLEEWEKAADQYDLVVAMSGPSGDAREATDEKKERELRQLAAKSAILAWEKVFKLEKGELAESKLADGQKVTEGRKDKVERTGRLYRKDARALEEQKLTRAEERLIAACDRYVQQFPGDKEEIDIRYQAAVIHYNKNRFVDAALRFRDIISRWPQEKRSQEAADLTLYILESKGQWAELNKTARAFLANKALVRGDAAFARRVENIVEGSQYKYVYDVLYGQEKKTAEAAEQFLAFVKEFPRSKNAARALTASMLIFKEAGQFDRAVEVGERILREYPGSNLELRVRYNLASQYQQIAEFKKAAEAYEDFVVAYDRALSRKPASKAKKARSDEEEALARQDADELKRLVAEIKDQEWVEDALFNAGLWWEGTGRSERAIDAYRRYMRRFPDRKDVPSLQLQIALIHERDRRYPEKIAALGQFLEKYARDARVTPTQVYLARHEQLQAWAKLKKDGQVERVGQELIAHFQKLPPEVKKEGAVLDAYAQARFLAVEPLWEAYRQIQFKKVPTIRRDLALKQKKLAEVKKAYEEVLAIGSGEYGIAAVARLGFAYEDMARNILDSPTPRGLDEEQTAMYRGELENLALPIEDQAAQTLETALAKAYELGIYGEWTTLAQERLNGYRPGSYGKARAAPFRGSEFLATAELQKAPAGTPPGAAEQQPQERSTGERAR